MISIVIVHWNTPDLLAACLDSMLRADDAGLIEDVIVVDCASTDESFVAIAGNFPAVKLVRLDRNDGYAAGCNAGLAATSSEFVLFLNADTSLLPDSIDLLLRCLNLNPRIGLVAPLLLNPDGTPQSAGYRFPGVANVLCDLLPVPDRIRGSESNGRLDPGNLYHPYAIDYPLGAAMALRRAALEDIGGWNESFRMYSEEIDLARRLDSAGWSRLLVPRARVIHHGGASTGQRPTEMQAALWRSRGRYHRLWSSRIQRLTLRSTIEVATRIAGDRSDGQLIRQSFADGLAGR
ncbi:glycosyltransferase family 2 protein [soil metagenome]